MSSRGANELVLRWCDVAEQLAGAFESGDLDLVASLLEQREALVQEAKLTQIQANCDEQEAVDAAEARIAEASERALHQVKRELEGVASVSRAIGRYSSNQR